METKGRFSVVGWDVFQGMEGLTLDRFKVRAGMDRGVGKLNLVRHGGKWVLLHRPPGQQPGTTYFLMGEKSGKPRLFAKADTALRIASTMCIPGLWVSFTGI